LVLVGDAEVMGVGVDARVREKGGGQQSPSKGEVVK